MSRASETHRFWSSLSARALMPFYAGAFFLFAAMGPLLDVANGGAHSPRQLAANTLFSGLVAAEEPAPLAKLYARMLLDRGEKQAAISMLQNHRPAMTDTEYDAFLAAMLQQQGRFAEAGTIYRQLLDSNQNLGSWWIGLAMSSDSLGDRADAMAAFQRALRADALKPALAMYARRRIAELQAND